jgi:hypothetical protein
VKPEKLYQELKDLAEKIGIQVSEHNFRITTGIRVKSGFCKVKDQDCCIIDKHLKLNKKMEALAECIHEKSIASQKSIEDIYIVPAVRDYMERFRPIRRKNVTEEVQVLSEKSS